MTETTIEMMMTLIVTAMYNYKITETIEMMIEMMTMMIALIVIAMFN